MRRVLSVASAWILAFSASALPSSMALAQGSEPYYPAQNELPPGPWQDQCFAPHFEGHYLVTSCDIDGRGSSYTRWDMSRNFGPLIVCGGDLTDQPDCNTGSRELPGDALPGGPWRLFCDFVRWEDGPTIVAMCPNDDNVLEAVRIDAPFYRPSLMACDLTVVIGEDGTVCNRITPDITVSITPQPATPPLPPGDWSQTCSLVSWDGDHLQADCRDGQGGISRTSAFGAAGVVVTNCDGRLLTPDTCATDRAFAARQAAASLPPGSWSQSCVDASFTNGELRADCSRPDGSRNNALILVNGNTGPISNCYGVLYEGGTCPAMPPGTWQESCWIASIAPETASVMCPQEGEWRRSGGDGYDWHPGGYESNTLYYRRYAGQSFVACSDGLRLGTTCPN